MVGLVFNLKAIPNQRFGSFQNKCFEIIPNSSRFKICSVDEKFGTIRVKVRSPPVKGKANVEIEKEFGKIFGSGARIISGHGCREKRLLISGIEKQTALDILKQFR